MAFCGCKCAHGCLSLCLCVHVQYYYIHLSSWDNAPFMRGKYDVEVHNNLFLIISGIPKFAHQHLRKFHGSIKVR